MCISVQGLGPVALLLGISVLAGAALPVALDARRHTGQGVETATATTPATTDPATTATTTPSPRTRAITHCEPGGRSTATGGRPIGTIVGATHTIAGAVVVAPATRRIGGTARIFQRLQGNHPIRDGDALLGLEGIRYFNQEFVAEHTVALR